MRTLAITFWFAFAVAASIALPLKETENSDAARDKRSPSDWHSPPEVVYENKLIWKEDWKKISKTEKKLAWKTEWKKVQVPKTVWVDKWKKIQVPVWEHVSVPAWVKVWKPVWQKVPVPVHHEHHEHQEHHEHHGWD